MIDSAINFISTALNQHLTRTYDLFEDVVVVSNILEQDGTVAGHVNNKIVVSLVNIEKDTVPLQRPVASAAGANSSISHSPPQFFNLYLMFASYFSGNNYQEGLKFISRTISYFQGQPVFNRQNAPEMDSSIDKLILDIENLSISDLSNLWGVLSGKYLPSVLYKVRMAVYDSDVVIGQAAAMSGNKTVFGQAG